MSLSKYVPEGKTEDFGTDPNILLLNLIKGSWNASGAGGDPLLTVADKKVRIATRSDNYIESYQIIIRPLGAEIKTVTTGGNRDKYIDRYRIEVLAKGQNGRDKMWKMAKEVQRIININKNGLKSSGIRFIMLTQIVELPVENSNQEWYRTVMTCTLHYHKVAI